MKIEELRNAADAQEKATKAPWVHHSSAGGNHISHPVGPWSSVLVAQYIENEDVPLFMAARSLPLTAIADVVEAADELADEVAEYRNCKLDNGDMPSGVLRAADVLRAALAALEANP